MRHRPSLFLFALASAGAAQASEGPLVIAHVDVVDVIRGEVIRDRTVVVRGGVITEVRPARTPEKPPGGGTILDATGKYLIPGLWDMHAHLRDPERELPMLVANGVLGVRDMGGAPEAIFGLRKQVASGALLGPRILACGPDRERPQGTGGRPGDPRCRPARGHRRHEGDLRRGGRRQAAAPERSRPDAAGGRGGGPLTSRHGLTGPVRRLS